MSLHKLSTPPAPFSLSADDLASYSTENSEELRRGLLGTPARPPRGERCTWPLADVGSTPLQTCPSADRLIVAPCLPRTTLGTWPLIRLRHPPKHKYVLLFLLLEAQTKIKMTSFCPHFPTCNCSISLLPFCSKIPWNNCSCCSPENPLPSFVHVPHPPLTPPLHSPCCPHGQR